MSALVGMTSVHSVFCLIAGGARGTALSPFAGQLQPDAPVRALRQIKQWRTGACASACQSKRGPAGAQAECFASFPPLPGWIGGVPRPFALKGWGVDGRDTPGHDDGAT